MKELENWVEEQAKILKPKEIVWISEGEGKELENLVTQALKENFIGGKVLYELNQTPFPHSFLHRSHPEDVARTEHRTFLSFKDKNLAGPTNNFMGIQEAKELIYNLSKNAMEGRKMYVIPFIMGNPDSHYSLPCVQITDSIYVAISMCIMTRAGKVALEKIKERGKFIKGIHSLGNLDKDKKYIIHFPEEELVVSLNSGYGGNALLGKKCIALRIASYKGWCEGWLAEHMLIIEVENPEGKKFYFAAAAPSASGKTNLALLSPTLPGWKVRTLGDDIAWIHIGDDGKLYALNPEAGFFGVAPGTSSKTNPNMIKTLKSGKHLVTIFTNVALDPENLIPWWEGLEPDIPKPKKLLDWQGKYWDSSSGLPAAHPNSRFTVSIRNCPILSPEYDNPKGVPLDGIIFGSRRSSTIPLVFEAKDWQTGIFFAATMGAETTAAAEGKVGIVRRDPFSMLPFCGYNMAYYFKHWLKIGKIAKNKPKIFFVNWFRKKDGYFVWPGFGENIRVIKWMIDRIEGKAKGVEKEIGIIPKEEEIDLSGLEMKREDVEFALSLKRDEWEKEISDIEVFLKSFGDELPDEIRKTLHSIKKKFKNI
ncbi:Phosphoenolpyruvate carboxykinase [GTP] [bacterium HR19]|nr:Phosphoenolpyruvate carboxykinase [GTP] [bacterium HR19]